MPQIPRRFSRTGTERLDNQETPGYGEDFSTNFHKWSMPISGTDSLEVPIPYIRPIFQAYVREYPHKIWPYMVQYLHVIMGIQGGNTSELLQPNYFTSRMVKVKYSLYFANFCLAFGMLGATLRKTGFKRLSEYQR